MVFIRLAGVVMFLVWSVLCYKYTEEESKCPRVRAARNFDLSGILGEWFVVQYYASSEEELLYSCMRADFTQQDMEVTMNFTYLFADDPLHELLQGNITWNIPESATTAHWIHKEEPYEGVYNTYVLDSDYKNWALLMHCAEKLSSTRYLSALIMSRKPTLEGNVIAYLKDKLPRYDIETTYLFAMTQDSCDASAVNPRGGGDMNYLEFTGTTLKRHPMKSVHKKPGQSET